MAIEDAAVLAAMCFEISRPSLAFRAYERLRFPRTSRVTTFSRYYGVIAQWKSPGLVWLRNQVLRMASSKAASTSYDRFVSYDPWSTSEACMSSPNKKRNVDNVK
jgi:2-polyprenyl-6-methoxyphenol hydroxylase-like FAD-dependent oxidoreductase